jgi:copper chaperone CopZ
MKKCSIVSVVVLAALFSRVSHAEEITISVKGMVCSFCAQGIKKTFLRKDGVEQVDVDLDKKVVTIKTKAGAALSDADVKDSIVDAGYEVVSIDRKA